MTESVGQRGHRQVGACDQAAVARTRMLQGHGVENRRHVLASGAEDGAPGNVVDCKSVP